MVAISPLTPKKKRVPSPNTQSFQNVISPQPNVITNNLQSTPNQSLNPPEFNQSISPDLNQPTTPTPQYSQPEYTNYGNFSVVTNTQGKSFMFKDDDAAKEYLQRQINLNIQPVGSVPEGTAKQQMQQQQVFQQEQQALIENETPQLVELNPESQSFLTKLPLIGSMFLGAETLRNKINPVFARASREELLLWAKNDIQRKEIEKGLTWSESIGAFIEGFPGGKSLNKWLDIESPRGNLEEVYADIKSQRRRVSTIESNVKTGYLPVEVAQEQIDDIEQYVLQQEARLKLLILNAPSLRYNSDRINSFETDILSVKEKIFQAKLNILSGAIEDPTELELYLKMQEQDNLDWETTP